MKKTFIKASLLAILGIATTFNLHLVLKANKSFKATLESIESIGQNINDENNQESNNNGSGIFFYEHRLGVPKTCVLYRNVNVTGYTEISTSSRQGEVGWTSIKIEGIKETCPSKGEGCTVYTCTTTN